MSQSFFLRKCVYCFCSYLDSSTHFRSFPKWDYSGKQYILQILLQVFPLLIIPPLPLLRNPYYSVINPSRAFLEIFFLMVNVKEGQMCAMSDGCKSIAARSWSLEHELHPHIAQERTTFWCLGKFNLKLRKFFM